MSVPETETLRDRTMRFAILVDADNVPPWCLPGLLEEVARYGDASIRRAYGNWTTPQSAPWKEPLHRFAFRPIQQFAYTKGKNATDAALIIDAMDCLHQGRVDAFCIVSSDSDHTPLALRLRESGAFVLGVGEKKTPDPFVKACKRFSYIENISAPDDLEDGASRDEVPSGRKTATKRTRGTGRGRGKAAEPSLEGRERRQLLNAIDKAFDAMDPDDGWVHLSFLRDTLISIQPDFDPRNYGFKKMLDLVEALTKDLELRRARDEGPGALYVRRKNG